MIMASSLAVVAHRCQVLVGLVTIVVALLLAADVVDSTRVSSSSSSSATATNNNKPPIIIETIYPSCKKTLMPKRCSIKLSDLAKSLAETKAVIAGPLLAAEKLKNDTCITDCAAVLDTAASNVVAAEADEAALRKLKGYLDDTVINMYGPYPPCSCQCPAESSCSAAEAAEVRKLVGAAEAMTAMANLLKDHLLAADAESEPTKEKKAEAAAMEKSIDSGVLHVSCGLTKQPHKCVDELRAVVDMTGEANSQAIDLFNTPPRLPPPLEAFFRVCIEAIVKVNEDIASTGTALKNLTDIRALVHSYAHGDGKQPPPCNYSCPPPPQKPCSANQTAVVHKLNSVTNAWAALDKFLAQEIL